MVRSTIFWIHLVCGVATGLVVLMMSVTGVILTYERQLLAWADRATYATPAPGARPLPLEQLIEGAKVSRPDFSAATVSVRNEPGAPVTLGAGRNASLLVDRYSGEIREPAAPGLRAFFGAMTGWHRWFNATGESRATARAITGASNLAFLFLIFSGMYLWLPRVFKWTALKTRLWFNPYANSAKARDFNWHHVFGIWSAIPLAVVIATAVVFSYPWANDLVYRSVGEQPPGAGGGPRAAAPNPAPAPDVSTGTTIVRLGLDELIARAAAHGEWRTLTLTLPTDPAAATVRIGIDQGNGGQPQHRHTLTLDAMTGAVAAWAPFSTQTTGQKARSWIRFLHTGEALGIVGQTIAGLVSLTSIVMVWTGLALAWRRLVQPLLRRAAKTRPSTA
jgi:uncharacterized iron-regulated membrane protein